MSLPISIVIPVYKAEKYLSRCLESFLSQTFKDFEILLINDGSPDNSAVICEEYARKDARIRVIHKVNGGVSSARQCGIDHALGEYTIHADPDDWVESTMLEELYCRAVEDDADLVICDFVYENRKKTLYSSQEPSVLSSDIVLEELLSQRLHGSCCNKLIRSRCYKDNNICFPQNVNLWEDLWFICELLPYIKIISYISTAYYHYDMHSNENSMVRKISRRSVEYQISFCKHFSEKFFGNLPLKKALVGSITKTKELMFSSRKYSEDEVIDAFNEINQLYIQNKPKFRFMNHVPYCLFLVLNGRWQLARLIHFSLDCVARPTLKSLLRR